MNDPKPPQHLEMDRMNQSAERLLAALGDAQPPASMTQRLLGATQAWTAHHAPHRTAQRNWLPRGPAAWSGVAGLSAAALVITALALRPAVRSRPIAPAAPPRVDAAASRAQPQPTPRSRETVPPLPAKALAALPRHARGHNASVPQPQDSETAVALAEMRAPSHPAPPELLTVQERLLLRVAHSGDAQATAPLNAKVRARQEIEARAEVEAFFAPPPLPSEQNE